MRGHRDFQRLWAGLAVSQLGSAVGGVALPIVAVTVVDASTFQISLLAAFTAVTTALLAFPMGSYVEFKRKRPVMIAADIARFASLGSIPLAGLFHSLTFAHLCVVAVINATCAIAFSGAAQAHLKALVSPDRLVDANGRLESTNWLRMSVGPSLGGALVGFLSALGTLLIDAVSFLVSALAIRLIKLPEPAPPVRDTQRSRRSELAGGLHFVWGHPTLRKMLISWVCFTGAIALSGPVTTVFYLRDLHFTAFEYGLLMGLPSLGGFFGARLTRRMVDRLGPVRTLWWASMLRGPWNFLIPLATPGLFGVVQCGVGFFGLLFFAAMANSTMSSYRQLATPDHFMARVSTLWSFATTVAQPLFILAGGLLATQLGSRPTLLISTALVCATALLLPRHEQGGEQDRPAVTGVDRQTPESAVESPPGG
ncbi:MFS transporter [Actinopolymorpha alba]|uniref:MFS transporter n=1 Tax=Actinopolymorpha alba TaxID=533267 RepID=UPI00192A9E17|nr:MFS transporter [Actinopolymorpha alba]